MDSSSIKVFGRFSFIGSFLILCINLIPPNKLVIQLKKTLMGILIYDKFLLKIMYILNKDIIVTIVTREKAELM